MSKSLSILSHRVEIIMRRTWPTVDIIQILVLPYLVTFGLLSIFSTLVAVAECKAAEEKTSVHNGLTIRAPYELNLGQLRDLTMHQPARQWSETDFKPIKTIHPSNYAVLANPEKFNDRSITFVGYLWVSEKTTGCDGKPVAPNYRVYANLDDFQHEDKTNFVQIDLNRYFKHIDCFKSSDHVEAIGRLESKELLPDFPETLFRYSGCNLRLRQASLRFDYTSPFRLLAPLPALHKSADHNCIIFADKIELDTDGNIIATGNVVLEVEGQKAFCVAENLRYDPWTKRVQMNGEVHLIRPNLRKQFEKADFHIEDPNFLTTEPDVTVHYPFLQAR